VLTILDRGSHTPIPFAVERQSRWDGIVAEKRKQEAKLFRHKRERRRWHLSNPWVFSSLISRLYIHEPNFVNNPQHVSGQNGTSILLSVTHPTSLTPPNPQFLALMVTALSLLPCAVTTPVSPRHIANVNGGAELYTTPGCIDTGGLGLFVSIREGLVSGECYDVADDAMLAGTFTSFTAYPDGNAEPYTCYFFAYWKVACEGPAVAIENDPLSGECFNMVQSPESFSLDVLGRSFMWVCYET
jgi:hypothetical protein